MKKIKNSTDNYAQTQRGSGQNSTDNMNDGPVDKAMGRGPRLSGPTKTVNEMGRKFGKKVVEGVKKFKTKRTEQRKKTGENLKRLRESKMGRKTKDGKIVKDY
tara:strand:- start:10062 stop:10370 length:309 start_codon:yes stop_codon:yes gene_type:complete